MNSNDEAKAIQDQLNEISSEIKRDKKSKKIFIALPNMNEICVGLVNKLFRFAMQREYDPWFHFITEKRHADYARNQVAIAFLDSKCDYCCMIDHDVDPHPELLRAADLDKDIIAGNVLCWIRGELMSSIWQRSECEQCRNLEIFQKEGRIHDESQYRMVKGPLIDGTIDNYIQRWNPFNSVWDDYASQHGGINGDRQCRCKGTGLDPFVFRTHQKLGPFPLKVDSVGTAAVVIARRVFEKMEFPWFRFLYRPSGEILLTEDHYFCWKAMEYGFEVWADPKLHCSHYKTVDLLQLTGLVNKAYETGKRHANIKQSIVVPTK